MTLTARFLLACATSAGIAATFGSVPHAGASQFSVNVVDDDPSDCGGIQVTSRDQEVATAEEDLVPAGTSLRIDAPRQNGGIWISGASGTAFAVRACKFALGSSDSDAQARLQETRVHSAAGRISASGPADGRWLVYFIVRTPSGARVEATTSNGPITVRGADADVVARATNGPIGIRDSRGRIDAETVNGPISVEGSSGHVRVVAQNGPLSVELNGDAWDGEGLNGRTQNGPLSLRIPDGYRSGIVVQADGNSPFRCSRCDDARRTWGDDARRVEFGSGAEVIRLSTTNGPVTIKR